MNETTPTAQAVLSFAMDLGKSMVQCGAEISRVEESVLRVCCAYGMEDTQVFSIISVIVATTFDKDRKSETQSRRIYTYATNFQKLERLNALSRRVFETHPPLAEAAAELQAIHNEKDRFHVTACLGYILGASAFTVFFGGSWKDALCAAPIAVILYLVSTLFKVRGMNKLFVTGLSSAISGFLAIAFVRLGIADNASMIMIGDIMLIIPGLMLINSVREMLCGDVMSGLLRLLESLIISAAIACGFAIPLLIFK